MLRRFWITFALTLLFARSTQAAESQKVYPDAATIPQTRTFQAPTPMAVFETYVGDWACTEKIEGEPARVSDFRFDLDHEILRETITTPKSQTKPQGETTIAAFGFDAKTGRYVEIEMISGGHWYASSATAPDGGTFHWQDNATSETPSHWNMVLPKQGVFSIESYSKPQDKAPSYRAVCERKTK